MPLPLGTRTRTRSLTVPLLLLAALVLGGTAVAATGPAAARVPDGVRVVTYDGSGVVVRRASGHLHRLHATSPDFRQAMRADLDALWQEVGGTPECRRAPVVIVKRWRSDGWATLSDEGAFRPCPNGGHWAIWGTDADGAWHAVLGGQEVPRCGTLRRLDVPRNMWRSCYDRHDRVVRYTGP